MTEDVGEPTGRDEGDATDADEDSAVDAEERGATDADESHATDAAGADEGDRLDGFVGDGREKHVVLYTASGERFEYGNIYFQQARDAFVVSADPEFPPGATERYEKADLVRVDVSQHHSACFITTAVGDDRDLAALRQFRDDALAPSTVGRPLVALYETVSPPIARTLARHPDGRTPRFVRRLVRLCAGLARRRERASPPGRLLLAVGLTALYVVGVACAVAGHAAIRARERFR